MPTTSSEIPCPTCGEMLQPRLVRCYRCGSLLHATPPKKTPETPTPSQVTEVPVVQQTPVVQETSQAEQAPLAPDSTSTPPAHLSPVANDDAFDLASGYDVSGPSDDLPPFADSDSSTTQAAPPSMSDFDDDQDEDEGGTYSIASQSSAPVDTSDPSPDDATEAEVNADFAGSQEPPAPTPDSSTPESTQEAWPDDESEFQTDGFIEDNDSVEPMIDEVPHSEQTAGEVLLQGALEERGNQPGPAVHFDGQEEEPVEEPLKEVLARADQSSESQKKSVTHVDPEPQPHGPQISDAGLMCYCPLGHKIVVPERHWGKKGSCPKCRAPFLVPDAEFLADLEKRLAEAELQSEIAKEKPPPQDDVEEETTPDEKPPLVMEVGDYKSWLVDFRLHTANPQKWKLKSGYLEDDFSYVDLGVSEEGLLVVHLVKRSLFGLGDKNRPKVREKTLVELAEGKSVSDLKLPEFNLFTPDTLSTMKIEQPALNAMESIIAGVTIFGEGRIALRLPTEPGKPDMPFLSFSITEFRAFVEAVLPLHDLQEQAAKHNIPLQNTCQEYTCHFSEQPIRALEHLDYYEKDPRVELKLVGWKCGACSTAMTDEAREENKLGGKGGKSIHRAKCPNCSQKMGSHPLYDEKASAKQQPAVPKPPDENLDTSPTKESE